MAKLIVLAGTEEPIRVILNSTPEKIMDAVSDYTRKEGTTQFTVEINETTGGDWVTVTVEGSELYSFYVWDVEVTV